MSASARTVVITGASRGLGRGCALAFAAQGAEVILLARNTDVLNDLAIGSVDDVVAAVTFLASPGAGLITGTSLLIDGGYTAQ